MIDKIISFLRDEKGDMAEKAVVWALIILVAVGAFALLGGRIADAVTNVAGAI